MRNWIDRLPPSSQSSNADISNGGNVQLPIAKRFCGEEAIPLKTIACLSEINSVFFWQSLLLSRSIANAELNLQLHTYWWSVCVSGACDSSHTNTQYAFGVFEIWFTNLRTVNTLNGNATIAQLRVRYFVFVFCFSFKLVSVKYKIVNANWIIAVGSRTHAIRMRRAYSAPYYKFFFSILLFY